MSPDDPRHGTTAGYSAHRYEGSTPCDACRAGAANYFARRQMALARGATYTVTALGSIRRIRALVAIGWSMEHQAERLGVKKQAVQNFATKEPTTMIRVGTAQRYADLYDELQGTPGPSQRARQVARFKGWGPPLAWDDIDNPDEKPRGHKVCSARGCAGEVVVRGLCSTHRKAREVAA